jgi:hypothetical protein
VKDAGESARDEAPGRNKTGQSARDVAPGQTKDTGASGASEGSSGSGQAADKPARSKDERSESKSGDKADSKTKADRGDRDASKDRAGRDGDDKDRAAGADRDRDRNRDAAEGDRDRNRDTADRERDTDSERDRGATGASSGEAGKMKAKSLTNVTQEQRTKVKSVFVKHRDSAVVRDIDVSLNVGVVVPRSVRLQSVPSDIIAIVPEYRAYEYFIYENKVVIVDPATFEIVDIIILA